MLGTGLALVYRLPPGQDGGKGLMMLGMSRHGWGDFHFYIGLLMSVLVVLYLALHWSWVKRAILSIKHTLGWIALLVALAIGLIPLLLSVYR
jgi:hypothetical protein